MAYFAEISLVSLREPERPARQDTLYEGLGELIEDIVENGLIHPLAVRDREDGTYGIIAGHRRYLAHKELGRATVQCKVFAPGEGSDMQIRLSENLQRTQMNAVEEARSYAYQMQIENITASEVARRNRRSVGHVLQSVSLLDGNPDVLEALRTGELTKAQAYEINKIADELGQKTALHYAKNNGMTARAIKHYREGREMSGVDTGSMQVMQVVQEAGPPLMIQTLYCMFDKSYKPMETVQMLQICNECFSEMAKAAEFYNVWDAALRAGHVAFLPSPPKPEENGKDG